MAHANERSGGPDETATPDPGGGPSPSCAPASARDDQWSPADRSDLVQRLDHTLQRMRRVVLRPPGVGIPIPGLGRPVDISKVLACEAIADLHQQSPTVTVTDVALALQLERSTVSRLLSECAAEGLIERVPVPDDGRRVGLQLTDDGLLAIAGSAQIRGQFLDYVTQGFDDADVSTLVALLERFADHLADSLPEWLVSTSQRPLSSAASASPGSASSALSVADAATSDRASRDTSKAGPGA